MTRVVVAEDSAVTRQYLVHLLDTDPRLEVVGEARNGEEAVALVESRRPDVVVMDIEMPRMDGYEATRQIMERVPTPIVMVSAHSTYLEERAFEALNAGALMLLNKPSAPDDPHFAASALELVETVKLMSEVKVVRRWRRAVPAAPPIVRRVGAPRKIQVVAIGASAGGPPVVAEILTGLPANLGCPILVVQHIAPGFVAGLVNWLAAATPLRVKLAEPGEPARPGTVYVAPDDVHMGIADGRIRLTTESALNGFRPSVSQLLTSVAKSCGRAAIGVVLTGMGRDGADGLLALRNEGAVTIAQDEASSIVYGMPRAAIMLGAAEHVLPPAKIAEAIRTWVQAPTGDRTR